MKINLTTILLIAVAVLLVLQLRSFFDKVQKPEQMIRNEERLKYLEQQRLTDSVTLVETRGRYDSLIAASQTKFTELETKKQPIKNAINKVHSTVSNFDREQLRREFANGR